MQIQLDRNTSIPLGVQVKEQIKMLIHTGVYIENDQLPSIQQLASYLGINKNTVVSILKELEMEGYVESFRGKGVFVKKIKEPKNVERDFLDRLDSLITLAKRNGFSSTELINLISARYGSVISRGKVKALFVMTISQKLVDINVEKLKNSIPEADFDGFYFDPKMEKSELKETFSQYDAVLIPSILADYIPALLPKDRPVIRTMLNLKLLTELSLALKKGSRVAVIGVAEIGVKALSKKFRESGLIEPELTIRDDQIQTYWKDLEAMDAIIVCLSSRQRLSESGIQNPNIYVFSDYVDDASIQQIKTSFQSIRSKLK